MAWIFTSLLLDNHVSETCLIILILLLPALRTWSQFILSFLSFTCSTHLLISFLNYLFNGFYLLSSPLLVIECNSTEPGNFVRLITDSSKASKKCHSEYLYSENLCLRNVSSNSYLSKQLQWLSSFPVYINKRKPRFHSNLLLFCYHHI